MSNQEENQTEAVGDETVEEQDRHIVGARSRPAEALEEEGEIAADYLEELLDIVDFAGDIDIDVVEGRARLGIVCESTPNSLNRLVGRDAQVLEALQELTRLTVQTQTGHRSWLMLDVDRFREKRREGLESVAQEAMDTAQETGERVALETMNSFERKLIHDAIAKAGFTSESEGEGTARHVVVLPRD